MIRNLLWKEWHEQRWKLAFGCVILIGPTVMGLHARVIPDQGTVAMVLVVATVLLPLVIGMGLVAPERAAGSIGSLLSMPVHPWKIFAVKTAIGMLACIVPIAGALASLLMVAGGRELPTLRVLQAYGLCAFFALDLLVWIVALSINQPSEARAGMVGIAVITGLFGTGELCEAFGFTSYSHPWLHCLAFPFSRFYDTNDPARLAAMMAFQVLVAGGLWCWAARRLPKPERTRA